MNELDRQTLAELVRTARQAVSALGTDNGTFQSLAYDELDRALLNFQLKSKLLLTELPQ